MRNKLLDQIRLLAAFLVILIHAPLPGKAGQVFEAVSRVAVPLFFMISGYYAHGKSKEKLLKNARKTAIMLLWSVGLYFVCRILLSLYDNTTVAYLSQFLSLGIWVQTLVFNNGILLGHLWFLLALLYCYLLYALFLRKTSLTVRMCISVVLHVGFFVIREVLKLHGIFDPAYYLRNFLFVGIPFFLMGGAINQIKARFLQVPTAIWAVLICVGTALACIERFYVGCYDLYVGTGIAAVALFMFAQKPEIPASNVLASLGEKYAGDIYIFHSMMITVLNAAASVTGILHTAVFPWVRPIIVLGISIGVAFFRQMLAKLLFKRDRINCMAIKSRR